MQRILSTAVIVGLLAATAAAFAITERLKLTKSPIAATRVLRDHVSPPGHTTAAIRVRFRRADVVSASILDSGRHEVDTLLYRVQSRGWRTFVWNGLNDIRLAPKDGTYYLEVHFGNQHRTILLPNPLTLDTKPPSVVDAGVTPKAFSPDGDHQADHVAIHYKLTEPAHVLVFVGGHRVIRGRSSKEKSKVSWDGRVDGKLLPPRTYVLTIGAVDLAGNVAKKVQHVTVTLRYIELLRRRFTGVRAGGSFHVVVATDAKRYRWSFAGHKGVSTHPRLKLRAPGHRGTFVLTVTEDGHSDHATVTVK